MEREYIIETNTFYYPFIGDAHYEHSDIACSNSQETAIELANNTLTASIRAVKCIKTTCKPLADAWIYDGSTEDYYQVSQVLKCDDSIVVLGVKVYHRPNASIANKED